ncbi:hypothetical protein ACWM35_09570 [Neobacillus sp. K501]
MKPFEIQNMIIDDDFAVEEYVTVDFTNEQKDFSITFKKADLEVINAWKFENGTSIPANLSESMIESIREEVKNRIH